MGSCFITGLAGDTVQGDWGPFRMWGLVQEVGARGSL